MIDDTDQGYRTKCSFAATCVPLFMWTFFNQQNLKTTCTTNVLIQGKHAHRNSIHFNGHSFKCYGQFYKCLWNILTICHSTAAHSTPFFTVTKYDPSHTLLEVIFSPSTISSATSKLDWAESFRSQRHNLHGKYHPCESQCSYVAQQWAYWGLAVSFCPTTQKAV